MAHRSSTNSILVIVLTALASAVPCLAQQPQTYVTFPFSGVMQGNSIYTEGTPFAGSFTYVYPQSYAANGTYVLHSYDLTIQGQPFPIPPISTFIGSIAVTPPSSWNGVGAGAIVVSNGATDSFAVSIARFYTMQHEPGRVLLSGPEFTLSDSNGAVLSDVALPNLALIGSQFSSGTISIGYSIDAGPSAKQTGVITSLFPGPSPDPTPSPTPPLIDRRPPSIRVIVPNRSSVATRASQFRLLGTATDNVSPNRVHFRTKAPGRRNYGNWAAANLPAGGAKTKEWSCIVALNRKGNWNVQVRALDARDNASPIRTVSIFRR